MKTENNQNQGKEQEEVLNEPMAETQELNTPEDQPQEEIKEEELEVEENKDNEWAEKYNHLNNDYLRLMADFDNYRKRTIKEKAELIKNGGERVILDLLPVVDNFERALKTMECAADVASIKEGVELIYQQLLKMLKQNGVEEIPTADVDFDTEYHEAITTIPAPTPEMKDKIIDCTTKGYKMNDKVIRHSKVVVGQ